MEGTNQEAFISALTSGITAANFWGNIAPFGAFIATLVVFAFGYRVVRKVISGASRGKAKI